MNTGLQDAYNLGWKLGKVLCGRCYPALLESYHDERYLVGRQTLEITDRAMRDWKAQDARPADSAKVREQMIARFSQLAINYRHSSAVTDFPFDLDIEAIRAGDRAPDGNVTAASSGIRRRIFDVLRGTGHHLFLFAGSEGNADALEQLKGVAAGASGRYGTELSCFWITPPSGSQMLDTTIGQILIDPESMVHKSYGATRPSLYVIRPDQYIAFRASGDHVKELYSLLDQFLCL
jgi:hypothetical protein